MPSRLTHETPGSVSAASEADTRVFNALQRTRGLQSAHEIRWGMNSANGIMLRIQQSDERSAIARAAHMNRGTTVATAEKRGEWMEAALLRADRELAASDLRSSY
jgi:hypothetical protein